MAKGQLKSGEKSKMKKSDSMAGDRDDGSRDDLPADLAALKVTLEKLEQVRSEIVIPDKEPVPPLPVKMKKLKPASERNKRPVLIAKVADPEAPVKHPTEGVVRGVGKPQYSLNGQFLPHSVLGKEEDFREEQKRRASKEHGGRPQSRNKRDVLTVGTSARGGSEGGTGVSQEDNKRAEIAFNKNGDIAAMEHWVESMKQQKQYQKFLQKKVGREQGDLLMNIGEDSRQRSELLQQLDRNLAFVDYGKGYRTGSEFWSQAKWVGTEETGLQFTMSATQKGYPPVYEHSGLPLQIQQEKGYVHIPPGRRGWQNSEFLQQRMQQLQHIISEVDPKRVSQEDFNELMVRGYNSDNRDKLFKRDRAKTGADRMSSHVQLIALDSPRTENLPDEFYQDLIDNHAGGTQTKFSGPGTTEGMPVEVSRGGSRPRSHFPAGPALKIGGVSAAWEGDDVSRVGEIGASCRVIFEGFQENQLTSWLEIINFGSTVVRFNWTREKRYNPFEKPVDVLHQRFYFNSGPSVILPRQKILFPFVFKADNAGIYTENWQLNTTPKLCGGAKIIVSLRGIAFKLDKYLPVREEITRMLEKRQAESMSRNLLFNIIDAIHTPRPPPSPIDAFITDEEKFERLNPGLTGGVNEKLTELGNFYQELYPEEERENAYWDLDLNTIREKIIEIEDEKLREKLLKKFNDMVYKLTTPIDRPSVDKELHQLVYSNLIKICDGIVSTSMALRSQLGLADPEVVMPPETYEKPLGFAIKQREREEQRRRLKAQEGADKKDAKKGGVGGGKDKAGAKGGGGKDRPASKASASPKKEEGRSKVMSASNQPTDSQVEAFDSTTLMDAGADSVGAASVCNDVSKLEPNTTTGAAYDMHAPVTSPSVAATTEVDHLSEITRGGGDNETTFYHTDIISDKLASVGGTAAAGVDTSRTTTSIEVGETAEDDSNLSKYKERLHLMVRELVGDTLVDLLHAHEDIKSRHPWKPNLPTS